MRRSRVTVAAGFMLLAVAISSAHADFINGGFEKGDFTGWSTKGDASIQTSAFGSGPVEGTYQALINNGTAADGGTFSGTDSVSAATLNTFLGDSPLGDSGSGIKQTFKTTQANTLITFSWNFLTNEDVSDPKHNDDVGFYVLDNKSVKLASVNTFKLVGSSTPYIFETGYQTTTLTIAAAGDHTLGFGILNVKDSHVTSGMLIDAVSFVPEPSGLALAGIALATLGIGYTRRHSGASRSATHV